VPLLNKNFGADGWRVGWQMLSAFCFIIMLVAVWLVRNQPSDIGLKPLGQLPVVVGEQLVPRERKEMDVFSPSGAALHGFRGNIHGVWYVYCHNAGKGVWPD